MRDRFDQRNRVEAMKQGRYLPPLDSVTAAAALVSERDQSYQTLWAPKFNETTQVTGGKIFAEGRNIGTKSTTSHVMVSLPKFVSRIFYYADGLAKVHTTTLEDVDDPFATLTTDTRLARQLKAPQWPPLKEELGLCDAI